VPVVGEEPHAVHALLVSVLDGAPAAGWDVTTVG
jgi:hypothetical protein